MKVIIVGDGRVGSTIAEQLAKEGHDIVVIDKDVDALKESANVNDVMCIEGNGALYAIQQQAGADTADLLIACTSSDELNMFCCYLAKKIGAKHTIARVRNPEYSQQIHLLKDDMGLSMAINPDFAAANEITRVLLFPSAEKVELFARGRVELVERTIKAGSLLIDLSLSELYRKFQIKILVCAVQRGSEVIIPDGNFVLQEGDRIHIAATHKEIEKFFKRLGNLKDKVKTVLIIGGGRIGYYLAHQLINIGMDIKIIEQNYDRCLELCEDLPKATIICGDGTDHDLLKEEGLAHFDAFVAVTGNDEGNMIMSLYASTNNVPTVVTKVNRATYADAIDKLGLSSVVSPKLVTASRIVSYVRAMHNSLSSGVETLYQLVGGRVEALEFSIKEKARYIGIPLKDLSFKKDALIACIVRGRETIIPGGNDSIQVGDSVVVVTAAEHRLYDLEDILQ